MFSFGALHGAYLACRKNKRNTLNQLEFEVNLLDNLVSLQSDLLAERYSIGRSLCFLKNSPKLREVFAADFKDRVVHHLLVGHLEPFYEKKFIHDVYNNRKNTLFKKLFNDIDSSSLKHKKQTLYLAHKIIYHDSTKNYIFKGDKSKLALLPAHKTLFKIPKHLGLPIGNLTSQFFANVYLNSFDQFVKRRLKAKSYIRYVDDFVLFHTKKEQLLEYKRAIEEYLSVNLGLQLRDKALYLERYNALKGKMELEEIKQFLSLQASFVGHIKHADSYNLKKRVGVLNESNPFSYDRP